MIAGYRLYYMTKKMTDVVTVKDSSDEIIYRLQDLGELNDADDDDVDDDDDDDDDE